jgi:heat shock protein HslJ
MIRHPTSIPTIALAGLFLVSAVMAGEPDSPGLEGTAWVLAAIPGQTPVPGATPTLRFEGGRAGGSDGCNRYSTSYTADGSALRLDPAGAMTQMACAPDVMQLAGAFMSSLKGARSYRVTEGDLQLLGADGALLARFAPQPQELAGTSWRVIGYNNGKQAVVSVIIGTQLTMVFAADGRVSGTAGCSDYMGTYTVSAEALSFGATATTRWMCTEPERIMEQEQQFLKALGTVTAVRIEGNRAELRRADGALAVSLQMDEVK